MKITNINYSDDDSGAAIAVDRINDILNKSKINSNVLVFKEKNKKSNYIYYNKYKKIDEKFRLLFIKFIKKILKNFFSINFTYTINFGLLPSSFYKQINSLDSEIVNLHWIGNEMISINQISKIKKYLIWTLHDMWPYTSVENYINEKDFLEKYTDEKKKINFFCNYIFNKKIKNFKNVKIVICTSTWQKKLCDKSPIFQKAKKKIIPLPLNFNTWFPRDKFVSRKKYNISENHKVVLFVLSHKYASKRKGLDYVLNYLENTKLKNLFFLTTNCENIKINNENIIHKNFNNFNSINDMSNLYSSADLLLMPSRIESFGQTILEAQACDCPAVTFKNTGCEDIIEHLKTGYVSEYLDQRDFAKGIEWSLENKFQNNIIRETVKKKFSEEVIGKKYKELFSNLI